MMMMGNDLARRIMIFFIFSISEDYRLESLQVFEE
jgi:hypothetical protein